MPLVLKWQGYRKFCVNFILEINVILNVSQVLNIPKFCMYQESYAMSFYLMSFTGYIERVLNIPWVLHMPEFGICSGNNLKNTLNSNIQGKR